MITAKGPGSSSLMLWDEAGQNRSLDVYADLDVTSLRNSLDQSFPHSNVDVQSEAERSCWSARSPQRTLPIR